MDFSKINELKPYDLNCNIFDVYSYSGLSMQELLCQFFTKINECVNTSNEVVDLTKWLVNEGLNQETALKLNEWLNDGTFKNLINVNLFENLNNKIDNVTSQLEHKASKTSVNNINSKIDNLVLNGDGTQNLEIVQSRTSEGFTFKTIDSRLRNSEQTFKTGVFNIEFYDLVNKSVNSSSGELSAETSNRITTNSKYLIKGIEEFYLRINKISNKTINFSSYFFDDNGVCNNTLVTNIKTETDLYTEYKYTNLGASHIRLQFRFNDDSNISEDDVYENIQFYFYIKDRVTLINDELANMCYDNLGNKFSSPGETINSIAKIVSLGKNLFNKSANTIEDGYINSSTGSVSQNSQYKTTGLIRGLIHNEKYIISPRIRKFLAYDKNDKPIKTTYIDDNTTNYVFTMDSQWGSVKFTYYTSEENSIMLSKGDTPLPYEDYGYVFGKDVDFNEYQKSKINKIVSGKENNLNNKILFNFGDSIGAGDGNKGKGYAELFTEKYNMICYDFAVGGATLGETSSNNITTQVDTALSKGIVPDYILIEGGTNDISSYNIPIGSLTDNYNVDSFDKSTTVGGLEWIIYTLKTNFPNSKIAFVSVHKMGSRGYTSQIERQGICVDTCKKWSIPIIDVFNRGNLNTFLPEHHKFTNPTESQPNGDRTHPNELGYVTYYLPLIYETLSSI